MDQRSYGGNLGMKALGRSVLAATLVSAMSAVPALVSGANPTPPAKTAVSTKTVTTPVVVFFMGVDCPISNLYLKDLADLGSRYAKQGVQIVGIQSNAGTTQSRAAQHAREYKVAFPVLLDPSQRIANQLGAKRT